MHTDILAFPTNWETSWRIFWLAVRPPAISLFKPFFSLRLMIWDWCQKCAVAISAFESPHYKSRGRILWVPSPPHHFHCFIHSPLCLVMIQPHIKFCAWWFGGVNANPGELRGAKEKWTLWQGWKNTRKETLRMELMSELWFKIEVERFLTF